jgi:CrcB protein
MLAAVALGGALGAVGRYLVMSAVALWFGLSFPWGTLTVNVVGSFAMGALIEISALVWSPSPELRALLAVGVLGAFTTFSTFSLDVVALIGRGAHTAAGAYIALSVVLSIAALFAGLHLFRSLLG